MSELTLEEAREIYKKSDELKSLMLTKFSREELEKHEVTQEEFDKTFLELLGKCTKTVFLDEDSLKSAVPTNRIELRNDNNEWLFDIQFTGERRHFYAQFHNVWSIFKSQYGLSEYDIKRLMKSQMKLLFGMDDITPAVSLEKLAGSVKLIFGIEYDWMMR